MPAKSILLLLLLNFSVQIIAQADDDSYVVTGSKVIGSVRDGEKIRELIGNVKLTQGDLTITCDKAIEYQSKEEVELIGNVILNRDSTNIYTPRAYYYGENQSTYTDTNVILQDGPVQLAAESGYYFSDIELAEFYGNVKLIDTVNTLYSDKLIYYNNTDSAIAVDNVTITDKKSSIQADSLIHIRKRNYSLAFGNVRIDNPENNIVITGQNLEDFGDRNLSMVMGDAVLTKIDTSENREPDTLIILSASMESYDDSTSKLVARDSVRIIRGEFSSLNEYSIYYKQEERIFTYKDEWDERPPLLWYEESQLLGDTINIYLKDEQLNLIDIRNNALVLSVIEGYQNRYDQISGDSIKMYFDNQELARTEVFGNVLSIYYIFEDEVANGVLKSSSENAKLYFADNEISNVRLFGSVKSEYHPEDLIKGKEMEFLLPAYIIYDIRPDKKEILSHIPNF